MERDVFVGVFGGTKHTHGIVHFSCTLRYDVQGAQEGFLAAHQQRAID